MSSNRSRDPRLSPSRWTLRTRLLVAMVALFAAVSLIVAVVTSGALRGFLIGQLDDQLHAASNRATSGFGPPPEDMGWPGGHDGGGRVPTTIGPGQPPGTLGARIVGGVTVQAGINDANAEPQPISDAAKSVLEQLPVDGHAYTRDLGDEGEYRLIAVHARTGDVIVIGLPLSGVEQTLQWFRIVEGIVIGIGLLIAGLAAALIVGRALRPLRRVAATATRVAELPLDRGEVALAVRVPEGDTDPRTEVGQVGAALNRMLGHVDAAFAARHASETRVRQFVADASHELRTPLAAIRGYAELTRRSRDQVPDDIAQALRRVESEAGRMTTLVEDLLLLARLDAGRPVTHKPVDLTQLTVDAVSDAHISGPGHRWELDLPEEPVVVTGDGVRLHQVLANLLANARTHTPPGTRVTVHLGPAVDGNVTLRVTDNGPGIPPALLPEVFERFARGDTSRSRAAGSTGLGLAIVSAVVDAHHGTVEVDSRPGHTVFTVTLPVSPPATPLP